MSDEVKQARTRVPRSIIFSVVVNGLMQSIYMITVLFTIGDAERVSTSPLPIMEVYYQATGSKAATNLFVFMLIYIIFASFFNVLASVSRLIWAFSRDGGLPRSSTFAKVHPKLRVPVNALCFSALCVCILALINVGSSTAFNAIISLTALGLYLSYFLPILFLLLRRMSSSKPSPIPWGPFRLGTTGPFVNAGALCYILFTFMWMPLPTVLPVDRFNMNYAGPILGGIIIGAALDWSWNGKKRFQVPVVDQRLH
jgi:amino acid transporter